MKNILFLIAFIALFQLSKAQNCSIGGTLSSDATVCTGSNSGMLMLSGQTGNVIQWESSTDNFVTATTIANTSTMLNYQNLTQSTKFRAVVRFGTCYIAYSTLVSISVDPLSNPGNLSPDASICINYNNGTLTLNGYYGLIERWESSTDKFTNAVPILNYTNKYTYSNLAQTTQFRTIVKAGSCPSVATAPVTLTVHTPITPTFSTIPPICEGAMPPLLPSVSTNLSAISGTWNPSAVNNMQSGTYTFTPNPGQCGTTANIGVVVNQKIPPVITCGNATASSVNFKWLPLAGITDYSITTKYNGQPPVDHLSQSNTDYTEYKVLPGTAVTITVTPVTQNCYAPATQTCMSANCPTITVTPVPNLTICSGNIVPSTIFTSTPLGASFTWTNSNPLIGLPASGTGTLPEFTATNPTTSPIYANITVTPSIDPCAGAPMTYNIAVLPNFVITTPPINADLCLGKNGSFNVDANGINMTYQWQVSTDNGLTFFDLLNGSLYSNVSSSTLNITGAPLALNNNQYRVVIKDICHPQQITAAASLTVKMCSVWPGDADNNLQANLYDLFPIGLNYAKSGPSRASSGTLWQAYAATDWTTVQSNGINLKYADCDGNGTIDLSDSRIIKKNYNLSHNKNDGILQYDATNPDLYFVIPNTSVIAGQVINVEVWAGRASLSVNNIGGIGFRLGYDPSLVDIGFTKLTFTKSWLADQSINAIELDTLFENSGFVDGGIVRIDQTNQSGYGKIANLQMRIKSTVPNSSSLNLSFKEYKAINVTGNPILLNPINTSILTAINESNEVNSVEVTPNPSTGVFKIQTIRQDLDISEITITNIQGVELYHAKGTLTDTFTLDLTAQPRGIYFMHCQNAKGSACRKIVIQ